jgi:hypothetical protein
MMQKKRWGELTPAQQVGVSILGAVQLALLGAALWDIAHRTPEQVRGDRRMWAGLAFVNWVGPLAYFAFGRRWESYPLSRLAGKAAGEV